MNVTIVDVSDVAPERAAFLQPGSHVSPDGAWTLATDGCRSPGMARPEECDGIIIPSGLDHQWPVGRITRATAFQPWIGDRSRAAWVRKGRVFIGDPTTETVLRVDELKRLQPHAIIGHRHIDRLLVAGLRNVALLDHDGRLITTSRFRLGERPLIGGFSTDGNLYMQARQPGPGQPATLDGFDPESGQHLASTDIGEIHALLGRGIRTPSPSKSYTNEARKYLWGGWGMGRVGVTAHPEDQTMTLDVRIPTGETCELFGKTAALVDQHWIRIAVEA